MTTTSQSTQILAALKAGQHITPAALRMVLTYSPERGKLHWLRRPVWLFPGTPRRDAESCAGLWNGRYAGKEAFIWLRSDGYYGGSVFDVKLLAHRVAWALHFGEWPEGQIDHENGCKTDNRLENLRVVSNAENAMNSKLREDNKSGIPGVWWAEDRQKWCAQIGGSKGRRKSLGRFDTLEEAAKARRQAEAAAGYHENHGRVETPSGAFVASYSMEAQA